EGKWIGIGGKFEHGESPEQCLVREVQEETGLILTDFQLRGLVTFTTEDGSSDPMLIFVYTATGFTGEVGHCSEGTLQWIDTDKIQDLNLWAGDRLFWEWMQESDDKLFSARFTYKGEDLTHHQVSFY
ncbi:MAG: 8-oxo-dGTP diphosphatase, partial [Coriobacteriia bacterium]|nr:8-oxo-dGTP diphosphatase [Coriobacteriia bacterium]